MKTLAEHEQITALERIADALETIVERMPGGWQAPPPYWQAQPLHLGQCGVCGGYHNSAPGLPCPRATLASTTGSTP
jgi:hypothetical protein